MPHNAKFHVRKRFTVVVGTNIASIFRTSASLDESQPENSLKLLSQSEDPQSTSLKNPHVIPSENSK